MAIVDTHNNNFIPSIRKYLDELSLNKWEIKELIIDNEGTTTAKI